MSHEVDSRSSQESVVAADTILIAPVEGTAQVAYRGVRSGDQWMLGKSSTLKLSPDSNLFLHPTHIEHLRNADITVIVSSKSGAGLADSAFGNLLEPLFHEFNMPFSVHKTSSKTSHKDFIKTLQFSADKENVIVIFGGDTMVFDVLNSIPNNQHVTNEHRFTLCPVPCGTGNALATSLGITTIPIGISRTFGLAKPSREPMRLPLLKITIREQAGEQVIFAAVVCSWGLHASLVADSNDPEMRRQYGPQRFQIAAQRLVDPKPHIYRGTVEVDGSPISAKEHTYLLIAHVSHLEPTFPIAPQQTPLLDSVSVIEIGPMTGEGLMGVMRAVYAGSKHMDMNDVMFRSGVRKVRFTVDEGEERFRRICIDGEIFLVENGASIDVEMADMGANISV